MSNILWWGYRHINGALAAKRYFAPADLTRAMESPFVSSICMPFDARGKIEALNILEERI